MKSIIAAGAVLLGSLANPAFAACGTNNSYLSQNQINTLLSGRYACGKSTSQNAPGWNELHSGTSGGTLIEQHEGGSTVENVGTWTTSVSSGNAATGRGLVTYSYAGGVAYEIATVANANCNGNAACTTPNATYQFCGVSPAPAVLSILISTTVPLLTSCPSNP